MLFPNEPFFNVHDGVLGAIAIDDEKPMAIWSHYHADALAARMLEFRERLRVAEWTVGDTQRRLDARGHESAAVRDRLQACVARAEAERDAIRARLAELTSRARVMEAARQADWYAIKVSPFTFED
ncbi:MAG TPA: hypothetical protein PKE51_13100 [Gemmatimonadaceae bacterium]|nr:hypothetical protein [Gemmatimonadaceae bacterium]